MGKQMLGDFCEQFGYNQIVTSLQIKKERSLWESSWSKIKKWAKVEERIITKATQNIKKPDKPKHKAKKAKSKAPICHKCGKIGHYANNCWTQPKINELQIDKSLKRQLENNS